MIVSIIDELTHYLSGFEQEGGGNWREENERYLAAHSCRFHETLKLLPPGKGGKKLLELGASPYFMTLMLEHFSEYTVSIANAFREGDFEESSIRLIKNSTREEHSYIHQTFNVEVDCFPSPDHSFDIILCCEILEHLALDPTHMLVEIHRILKPGEKILITTPNVLVLRNAVSLLKNKRNIYYPYSGYGVYGRHNRELTLEEVVQIVGGCGYSIEKAQIVDTYPHRGYSKWLKKFFPFLRDMLVVVGCAENEPQYYYPENLYASLPRQYSVINPMSSRLQEREQMEDKSLK